MNLGFLGEFDRIYTYGRVSSTEQGDDRRNSIEGQESRLKAVEPKPTQHFRDIQGGDDPTRADFNRLIAQARSDAFKGLRVLIVVTDQSRLSRGEDAASLIASFDAIEVCVYALDDGKLTTKSPNQWLNVATKGVYNHYFVLQIRARLRGVNEQKRQEGRPVSRRPPYGLNYTREKLVINQEQFLIARKVVEKFLPPPIGEGWGLRRCASYARSLGWQVGFTGLREWLKNEAVRGHTLYSVGGCTREDAARGQYSGKKPKDLRPNTHEAIISEAEYQMIQRQLSDNKQFARVASNIPREPLSGLIFCGNCNKSMHWATAKWKDKRYPNYICRHESCDRHMSISLGILEPEIQKALAHKAEEIAIAVQNTPAEELPDPELLEWTQRIQQLKRMYDADPMAEIRQAIEKLQEKIAQREKSPGGSGSPEALRDLIAVFSDPAEFEYLPKPEKRIIYHELIQRVTIFREQRGGDPTVRIELLI